MPIVQLFRKHALLVLIAALVFAGNNAVGYMTTGGYIQNYSTNPEAHRPRARPGALGGRRLRGRRGCFDVLRRLDLRPHRPPHDLHHRLDPAARRCLPAVPARQHRRDRDAVPRARDPHDRTGLHLRSAGRAVLRAVPASIRFSGVSISYAIGAIIGGAFAPTIAQALVPATGSTESVAWYLAGMTLIGLVATLLLRDRSGIPLGPDHEAEQAVSPIYGMSKV